MNAMRHSMFERGEAPYASHRPIVYRRLYDNALSLHELEELIRSTSPRPIEAIEALYGHILR